MVKRSKPPAPTPLVKDYIVALRQRMIIVAILPGIVAAILCATILIMSDTLPTSEPVIWVLSAMIGIVSSGGSLLIFILASAPVKELLRAIAHVSGEPIAGSVPNPHDRKYATSGLGTALKTIYTLDSNRSSIKPKSSSKSKIATASIDRMNGAIITLDSNRSIIYASRLSPLHTVSGALQPQLLFTQNDSLDLWLSECEASAVKAERRWQRIPDRPADMEGQRIFDVYASYEKGSLHETVLTLVDMTERYHNDEEDLNFIAFAAHELRGPITVIRGYLDVLQDELGDVLADDQKELFHRLSVSANRLSSYINNILNTSRFDRRHLNLTLLPDKLTNIYSSVSDDMQLRATSQHRMLCINIPEDLPQIAADRASLSEVISNLIDNAIKYSNEGGLVTVTANQNGDFVDIHVEDHGIGMAGSVIKNLCQKFYRSHRS